MEDETVGHVCKDIQTKAKSGTHYNGSSEDIPNPCGLARESRVTAVFSPIWLHMLS